MTEPTTGSTAQADGITDEDRAIFEQVANEGMACWLGGLVFRDHSCSIQQ